MKNSVHRRIFIVLLGALALVVSCIIDISEQPQDGRYPFGLSLIPQVFRGEKDQSQAQTKVPDTGPVSAGDRVDARDGERENFFRTLDVFVKEQSASETATWFKTYHLVAGQNAPAGQGPWQLDTQKYLDGSQPTSLLDEAKNLLANNWSTEGYDPSKIYDIYVAANNPHTMAGSTEHPNPDLPTTLAELKALTTTRDDIYRYSVDAPIDGASVLAWTNWMYQDADNMQKEFMMDGKIEGWAIDPNSPEQVFEVPLNRAAAKILLNVKFDGDNATVPQVFDDNDDNYWPSSGKTENPSNLLTMKDYLTFVNRTVGVPRWKFVNFALEGADVADGSYIPAKADLQTYGGNFNPFVYDPNGVFINDSDQLAGNNVNNTFQLVTYTFPVDWTSGNAANNTEIPYVLLSFGYTRTTGQNQDMKISYYRIPVCDERSVTKLERNHIYIVDVTISSMGSSNENLDLEDQELRIEYHVIPWEGIVSGQQQVSTVTINPTKYLTVTPKTYTLKGDGVESVDLQWYASVSTDDGQYVDIENDSQFKITYVNYLGNTVNIKGTVTKTPASPDGTQDIVITSTAPTTGANGETVVITITKGGVIRVQSQALASRAVKKIEFDVQLKGTTLDKEHVVIEHFPLDNIQSIAGKWSSRWQPNKEYTYDLVASGWDSYDGVDVEVTNYGQQETVNRNDWTQIVPQSARQSANSQQNGYYYNGYVYWGTGSQNANQSDYDWYTTTTSWWGGTTTTYYRYQNLRRCSVTTRNHYWRYVDSNPPTTGNWVAWDSNGGSTTTDGMFTAKVYVSNNNIDNLTGRNQSQNANYNGNNNHMYVIQVTATSTTYALGKPVLDDNYQSQDKVVSPAFMIASQLGAVQPTSDPVAAATHCGTYMETGDLDAKRYVGWRLPTKQEIEVIIGYQNGDYTSGVTMVEVLGGQWYWSLDGTAAYVSTGSQGTETNAYVRCVRDLTLDEVTRLNNGTLY